MGRFISHKIWCLPFIYHVVTLVLISLNNFGPDTYGMGGKNYEKLVTGTHSIISEDFEKCRKIELRYLNGCEVMVHADGRGTC